MARTRTWVFAGVAAIGLGFGGMYLFGDHVEAAMEAAHGAHEWVMPRLNVGDEPSRVIYLNREGARLVANATNDAQKNLSSIVHNHGVPYFDMPAFRGTPARWDQIRTCIAEKFAPYNVRVVDQRPVEGDYIMAVFGGTPKGLPGVAKHGHAVTGLAPFNGQQLPNAVVMIFTRSMKGNVRDTCETAGMEIAHAYGLDHGRECRDLMTYKKRCSSKRTFVDKEVRCGEGRDRDCKDGNPTQNSHQMLLRTLGPRP